MSKLKVSAFAISLDGFGSGPSQDLENPMGVRGHDLQEWFFKTDVFRKMIGNNGGETGVDNDYALEAMSGIGAWIMGRNMFGPIRDNWPDDEWKGWWGPNPPYHVPVYVLTHYPRKSITMEGGTTFHFVTDGIESALIQAKKAAGNLDVRIGGGASTIRQYLKASLIDEMHLVYSPVFLGQGESLLSGIDVCQLGFNVAEHRNTELATHIRLKK